MSNKLYNNLLQSTTPNAKLITYFGAAIVMTAINSNYQQQPTQAERKKERDNIEVYLMDHIANKRKFIVLRKYIICTCNILFAHMCLPPVTCSIPQQSLGIFSISV